MGAFSPALARDEPAGNEVSSLLSGDPGTRAAERFFLLYTPVWGAVCGLIMLTGLAEPWGDGPLMTLGVGLFGGTLLGAWWRRAPEEREVPPLQVAGVRIALWLAGFAFLMNYFGTRYFYEVLHAHYGFRADITVNDVPLFLYFMTLPYFATYFALVNVGWRLARRLAAGRRVLGWALGGLVPVVVAGLESALNANPWMQRLYCFDDLALALSFGTLLYGAWLGIATPFWLRLGAGGARAPWHELLAGACAAAMLSVCVAEVFKHQLAPLVTTVRDGHVGLRDPGPSCLQAP